MNAIPTLSVDSSDELVAHKDAWGRTVIQMITLFLLATIPYLTAINGELISDDEPSITQNPAVRAINGLWLIWNPYRQTLHYFPMNFSVLWAGYQLWGLHTFGYHLINIILHGINAVLVWRVLRRLSLRCAWAAALIWAIHPVQHESVAWISELKNVLSGFFYFLSILAYLRFAGFGPEREKNDTAFTRWSFYVWFLIAFALGMLSKSLIYSMPILLGIIIWWKKNDFGWRDIVPLVPPTILGFGIAIATAIRENAMVGRNPETDTLNFTFIERTIISSKALCGYVLSLIWPYPLLPIFPRWDYAAKNYLNYLPIVLVAGLTIILWTGRKKYGRAPIAAWLYFVITLGPLLGFLNYFTMLYTFEENHFQYLACLSLIALTVEGLYRGWARISAGKAEPVISVAALRGCFTVLVVVYLGATAFYSSLYDTNFKLWSWTVDHNPEAFAAQHNLSVIYWVAGNKPLAYEHIHKSLNTFASDAEAWRTLGQFQLSDHLVEEAKASFEHALACRADYGLYYTLLGHAYRAAGEKEKALELYAKGVKVSGGDPDTLLPYATALIEAKRLADAEIIYGALVRALPGNLLNRYNFGNLLMDEGKPKEAIEQYEFAIKYQSNVPDFWYNLAAAYYQLGRVDDAIAAKKKAQELEAATRPAN